MPTPGGTQGQFTVLAAHTYTATGNFSVQTSVSDVGGSVANPSSTATVATPTTGSVAATEGAGFSGVVATFSANPSYAQSATINWGDGSNPTAGTITPGQGNTFTVSGNHTYSDEGVYDLQVQVTMSPGPNLSAAGPAVVADAALTAAAATLPAAWAGQPLGMTLGQSDNPLTVATFSDANTAAPAAEFTAQITWGDGITSAGTVSGSAGQYTVKANHSYAEPGSYTVATTVSDKGGSTGYAQSTATVGVREGQEYDAVLILPLPNPVTTAPPSSYNATVTWGDGSPNSSATATPVYSYTGGQLTGSLLVTAAHVYAAAGNVTVSATATNPQTNNSSNATQPLVVGDALLNPIGQTISAVTGQATGTISVGQFFDDNTSATASGYTAQINWGDGSQPSAGTVVAVSGSPAGTFAVQGSHTYSTTGIYSMTITVSDSGGQQATIASTAAVNPAWTLINLPADQGNATGARTMDPSRAALNPNGGGRGGCQPRRGPRLPAAGFRSKPGDQCRRRSGLDL